MAGTEETGPASPARVYYATEARNATLRELWRMAPPTVGGRLAALLVKALRLAPRPAFGMALDDPVRCSPAEVPELRAAFEKTLGSLAQLGFQPAVAMRYAVVGCGRCSALAFLGRDPTVYALVVHSRACAGGREHDASGLSFLSRDETTVWATTSMPQALDVPPLFRPRHLPGCTPERLHEAHGERRGAVPEEALRRFGPEELWSALCEHEAEITRFQRERGVFRPMTASEVAAAREAGAP